MTTNEQRIIAYSYYILQLSGFCNMYDYHCVMKTAKDMKLTEFYEKFDPKVKENGEVYFSQMITSYQDNVSKLVERNNTNRFDAITKLVELRKEKENEGISGTTKKRKKTSRSKSKNS